jgi:predicted  nucleic acid-binding Zn-ribbon protein
MTTNERLKAWRDQIAAELDKAQAELPALNAAREAAITTHSALESAWRDLSTTLRAITHAIRGRPSSALEIPLSLRVDGLKRDLDMAASARAQAHHAHRAGQRRIAELERALMQLDRLLEPPAEEAAA